MINSLDVKIETKTKDNVFVQLVCSIQYRVVKALVMTMPFMSSKTPREQIQAYVFDVVRALVHMMMLDALFEQKGEVAKSVLEELEKVMGAYGYSIEHILMVDILLDPSVRKAMNEINASQRLHGETTESTKGTRTSSGTFLSASEESTGAPDFVEKKIARATMIPRSHGEV
ncbi:hypothetical protein AALP_AAs48859U000100 [Arabis alpina]|uniref:Band 7 domain-containing protein n=1 Tax=Arabis alpina TaxID=50452 RepID=A0A087FWP7_ARAAL|nr:hypothetical protein AALP_AAs48859U000100 [Arabis alpina]